MCRKSAAFTCATTARNRTCRKSAALGICRSGGEQTAQARRRSEHSRSERPEGRAADAPSNPHSPLRKLRFPQLSDARSVFSPDVLSHSIAAPQRDKLRTARCVTLARNPTGRGAVMSNSRPVISQTRAFSTIFLIELWERFGYYGMAALLVLFMVEKIGFGDTQANLVWGAFTALVYAAPAIGGWIGDNVLGTRRTMPIGAAILGIGYLMLVGAERQPVSAVCVDGCDRRRQRPVQGQRREHGAPHLRRRRRQDRQRVHALLHGGQRRLDRVDAADAMDQGPLGLACRLRGLLRSVSSSA